jgi:preprotein translocase subunit SecG
VLDTVLTVLHFISAIGLITVVLLQSGKSAGLSGTISGGAESLFGSKAKGMDALLSKLTTGFAIVFMALAIVIAVVG